MSSDKHESATLRREGAGLTLCLVGLAAVVYFAPPEAWELVGLQARPFLFLLRNAPHILLGIVAVLMIPVLYWAVLRWKYAE